MTPNTNEVVSYLSITINPEKLTQMQIAFPHAVNLKSPIKLQIDDKDPIELIMLTVIKVHVLLQR